MDREVAEFYTAYYPKLVTALSAASRDRDGAEDAAQEAFARLLRTHGLDRLDTPEAWLYTVGLNVVRSRWRALARARAHRRLSESVPQPGSDPECSVQTIDLQRALRELPDFYRDTLVLFYLLDLPVARIADHYRVSVGTIKSRLSRGRAMLASRLQEEDPR